MPQCPICRASVTKKYTNSPYWACDVCDLWFQHPNLPKNLEKITPAYVVGERDKEVYLTLAKNLFGRLSGPGKTLDIGETPYLSKCFKDLDCDPYAVGNITEAPDYTKEFSTPMWLADFETLSTDEILSWSGGKFSLITMVHQFHRCYFPLDTLRKLRQLVTEDGFIYLRLPDHSVDGFEKNITPANLKIHPYYWSMPSILELLVQGQDQFTVQNTYPMDGAGQRDFILSPLTRKPQVWCGMIVKNEERDLPKCLESIKEVVDGVVIIDTGSVDKTEEAAKAVWTKPLIYETYLEASKQDETGDWKLWDFSKARNVFVDKIDAIPEADYQVWFDADDTLQTPANLRRAFYLNEYSVFGMMIDSGAQTPWVHHRAWKTRQGVRFGGRIHEYPDHGGRPGMTLQDSIIHHDAAPGIGENSNARNLRILELEMEENPTPRTAFYLANTHKDGARFKEAVPYYQQRIDMGVGFRDEWLFAYLYKGRCERAAGMLEDAEKTLLEAVSKAPEWAEFWMELGYISYQKQKWQKAIGYCLQAVECTVEKTELWRELNKYMDQPRRMLSFCYEALGDKIAALKWAIEARETIGANDREWNERIVNLENLTSATPIASKADIVANFLRKSGKQPKRLALHRPGAIGDVVMILNLIPILKKKYPNHEVHFYCHPSIGGGLAPLFDMAGIDAWFNSDLLEKNKSDYKHVWNLIGYPIPPKGNYPEEPMTQHLIRYFAEEMGLSIGDELPCLSLSASDRLIETPYATIHPQAGWSMYKVWSMSRWEQVIAECPEIPFVQIGGPNDYKLKGANHSFMGHALIDSINLIANAQIHCGVDSFTNHLTHIKWSDRKTPGIIVWGSTHYIGSGYTHNTNICLELPCAPCYRENPGISAQTRGVCPNPPEQTYENPCHACMTGIPTEKVLSEVRRVIKSAHSKIPAS